MDPVTLIVAALAAGAATGMTESAASAVKDAYRSLLALVRKRLAGRPDAELVLARHVTSPETWQAPLAAMLGEASAEHDGDLVTAAQALMSLMDKAGARAGKYTVDTRGAYGVQVGDHNRQDNVFRVPPGG
jgi:long-subunit fatty acid transport protein